MSDEEYRIELSSRLREATKTVIGATADDLVKMRLSLTMWRAIQVMELEDEYGLRREVAERIADMLIEYRDKEKCRAVIVNYLRALGKQDDQR